NTSSPISATAWARRSAASGLGRRITSPGSRRRGRDSMRRKPADPASRGSFPPELGTSNPRKSLAVGSATQRCGRLHVFTCSSERGAYMRASPLPHGDFQPQGSLYRSFCWGSLELHIYPDATAVVRALAPDEPVICNRPHAAARAARFFAEKFPGK